MRLNVVLVCFFIALQVSGKNYYFSSQGNNSNSGTKKVSAWNNISNLASVNLKAGDSVLFRRGDTFTGEIIIRQSGSDKKPIVFGAYGRGPLPILTGALPLKSSEHKKHSSGYNIHSFSVKSPIYQVFVNEKKQTLARFPNSGYLTMGNTIDSIGFETSLPQPDNYWKDATIRMRTIDWVFENRKVVSFQDKKIKFDNNSIYNLVKGYGYFLDNKPELLDSVSEWYASDSQLSLILDDKIENNKIEAVVYENGIIIEPRVKHIIINSICIDKFSSNGIWLQKASSNIQINNNIVQNTGYMGVWLDTLVSNVAVKFNKIHNIAGRGISAIRLSNSKIEHNEVSCIGLYPGEGISGVNGMIAIAIENDEKNHDLSASRNNFIAYNLVDSTGYAGIRMDGQKSICEFNIVKNTSLKLNDSGAIYCWGKVRNRTKENIIRNNLVINAIGNVEATPSNGMATNGIYVDNNSTQVLVDNNTLINVSNSGIHVNDGSPLNTIKNNTTYNCADGISFAEWAQKDSMYGNFTENNKLIGVKNNQHAILITTFLGPKLNPGKFANNTYLNFNDGFVINYKTDPQHGQRRSELFRIANWQQFSNNDLGSKSIERKGAQLIYNESFIEKYISLPEGEYTDIDGTKLARSIKLAPCSSYIIVPADINANQ